MGNFVTYHQHFLPPSILHILTLSFTFLKFQFYQIMINNELLLIYIQVYETVASIIITKPLLYEMLKGLI